MSTWQRPNDGDFFPDRRRTCTDWEWTSPVQHTTAAALGSHSLLSHNMKNTNFVLQIQEHNVKEIQINLSERQLCFRTGRITVEQIIAFIEVRILKT